MAGRHDGGFGNASRWAASHDWDPSPRLDVVFDLLAHREPGRLVDLGAGHGKFSVMAADLGWSVLALDARGDRFPSDDRIDWQVGDVREVQIDPVVDLVLNLGLLYHLELDDQLRLLRRCSVAETLVDTHAAVTAHVEVDGFRGAWFDENLAQSTASVGNERSFWPVESDLVRQFHQAGFGSVWRLTPETQVGRTFWRCLPAPEGSLLVDHPAEPSRHELAASLREVEARLRESQEETAALRAELAERSAAAGLATAERPSRPWRRKG